MCLFSYLAVLFREDMAPEGDRDAQVAAIVARHGRAIGAVHERLGAELARFGAGADVVGAFRVPECACEWREPELASLEAIARDLLLARDVRRVRIGWWWAGDGARIELEEQDAASLSTAGWLESDQRGGAIEVRRADVPPFPTATLAERVRRGC